MGDRAGEKSQYVIAYDLHSRKELWATRVGPAYDDGPRCTPTVDGDRLYAWAPRAIWCAWIRPPAG